MDRKFYLLTLGVMLAFLGFAQTTSFNNAQTTFFLQTNLERGYVLCPTGTGNLYVAGMKDFDMVLMEVNTEGEIISSNYINVGITGLDVLSDLIVDTDGHIVVCGNLAEDSPSNGFVFRYDPNLQNLLWARSFIGDETLLNGVLESESDGNFIVYANPHNTDGDDAEVFRLDRNTGNIVPGSAWRYGLGASDNINAIVSYQGSLYAVGQFTDEVGSFASNSSDIRQALLKIDPVTGVPLWTKLSHVGPAENASLYGRDLVIDQGFILSTFSGNDAGADLNTSFVFLQKTTLDGDLVWTKKIDLSEWDAAFGEELVSVSDGYVILGRTISNDEGALFLVKTDKDGNLMWSRKIEHDTKNRIIGTAQRQLIAQGAYLYVTGFSENGPGTSQMFLLKANESGLLSDSCAAFLPTDAVVFEVPNPVTYTVTPTMDTSWIQAYDFPVAPPVHFIPSRDVICQQIDADDCQDMPDWTFKIDSIKCNSGTFNLYYTLCNIGGVAATDSLPVTFYRGNPTEASRPVFGTYTFDGALAAGECRKGVLSDIGNSWFPNGTAGLVSIFCVANDDASWPSPFALDTFPPTDLIECDYTNNLSFNFFLMDSPTLDLGPDLILCQDSMVMFDAGDGFLSYLWQDGSADQTINAIDVGTYWVEVTDACGFKQRDSIFFSFSLLADTQFPDTTICPGDVVTYSLSGFDAYSWAPSDGLSCTDCPMVDISPVVSTNYTLLASDSLGCVLTDTFLVEVITGPSSLAIQCPANVVVKADPGTSSALATFADPTVTSDCPCGTADFDLSQGMLSGSDFPIGSTQVCFEAADDCNTTASCCFTVTVEETPTDGPCDVKETSCVRFEILSISQNPAGEKTYQMRVINNCPGPLIYVAYQLPNGLTAKMPASNTIYTAPSGRLYKVRNPNASPFHSIRFKASDTGIANGASDVFEYRLPKQADPNYINAVVRLAPQDYYQVHLNVFDCKVQQVSNRGGVDDRNNLEQQAVDLQIFPNPVSDILRVDVTSLEQQQLRLLIYNPLGQLLIDEAISGTSQIHDILVPKSWNNGLYYLTVVPEEGPRSSMRFILAR